MAPTEASGHLNAFTSLTQHENLVGRRLDPGALLVKQKSHSPCQKLISIYPYSLIINSDFDI